MSERSGRTSVVFSPRSTVPGDARRSRTDRYGAATPSVPQSPRCGGCLSGNSGPRMAESGAPARASQPARLAADHRLSGLLGSGVAAAGHRERSRLCPDTRSAAVAPGIASGTERRTGPSPPSDRFVARTAARSGASALHSAAEFEGDSSGDGSCAGYGEKPAQRGIGKTAGIAAMNCDEFLPALETGGFFRRRAARRHAAGCSACTHTLAAWRALKHELTAAPPLTGQQRDLWTSVAQPGQVRPRANYTRRRAALAIAAAVLLS